MLRKRVQEAITQLFEEVSTKQDEAITHAAAACSSAIRNGQSVHLYDTGHIIDSELFNRAGGFALLRQFKYNLNVVNGARQQDHLEDVKDRNMEGLAAFALKQANIYKGDILFIGSVSGISFNVVDLALAAKEMGITVIVLSALSYSKTLNSLHPSNKKLYELGDIVIDNCAPIGDGMLEIEGIEQKFLPASGLSAAYIMWLIMADTLETLLEHDITPGILGSVNYPPNVEYNINLEKIYQDKGI